MQVTSFMVVHRPQGQNLNCHSYVANMHDPISNPGHSVGSTGHYWANIAMLVLGGHSFK